MTRVIIFIDGEGLNVGDPVTLLNKKQRLKKGTGGSSSTYQRQDYAVINAHGSDGSSYRLANKDYSRLTTEQCLNFLISFHRFGKPPFIVGFGMNYDFSQILKDLPLGHLLRLKSSDFKCVNWRQWKIIHIPNKSLTVTERRGKKRSVRIWDTRSFYQSKFVTAAENCGLLKGDSKEELLRFMKSQRDNFSITEMDKVEEYNELECDLGIEMFAKIRYHWNDLGLKLRQFHGAGAVASAMLQQNNIKEFMNVDSDGMNLSSEIVGAAYFGGRFDYSRQGLIGTVHEYDINSAYPFQASNLPCLSHARWVRWSGYHPVTYGVYKVHWSNSGAWAPFPYRTSQHHIRYYSNGAGYYYANEVESARPHCQLDVEETWELVVECEHKPFSWIPEYYTQRQQLLKAGDYGERIIKLGLNAIYGKLAQEEGYAGKRPAYQNYIWAGMITSNTRAMLLDAAAQNPYAITHMATDGIYSVRPLQLECHDTQLGAWEHKQLEDMLLVSNGIYDYKNNDKEVKKTRGWDYQAVPFDKLREQFVGGDFVTPAYIESKGFIGINSISSEVEYPRRCMWRITRGRMQITPPIWKSPQDIDGIRWLAPGHNDSTELSGSGITSTSSSSIKDNYLSDYEEWDGQY
jgi:hypothetical protein